MTRQKYIPNDNQWISFHKFDKEQLAEDIYDQVGARFRLSINADGTVILDFDDLPSGVKENDVKQAVKDNHPHR